MVVYQLENLATYAAVIDRLGQFQESLENPEVEAVSLYKKNGSTDADTEMTPLARAALVDLSDPPKIELSEGNAVMGSRHLVELRGVTVYTPDYT